MACLRMTPRGAFQIDHTGATHISHKCHHPSENVEFKSLKGHWQIVGALKPFQTRYSIVNWEVVNSEQKVGETKNYIGRKKKTLYGMIWYDLASNEVAQ